MKKKPPKQRGRKSRAALELVVNKPPTLQLDPEAPPKPPNDLAEPEKAIWRSVFHDYKSSTELARNILYNGLKSHQISREAQEQVGDDGLTVEGRDGQQRSHPLLSVIRDSRAAWLACVKALGLKL